jgi:hypothetical protein
MDGWRYSTISVVKPSQYLRSEMADRAFRQQIVQFDTTNKKAEARLSPESVKSIVDFVAKVRCSRSVRS